MPVPSLREAAERRFAEMDPVVRVGKQAHFVDTGREFGVNTDTYPLP